MDIGTIGAIIALSLIALVFLFDGVSAVLAIIRDIFKLAKWTKEGTGDFYDKKGKNE